MKKLRFINLTISIILLMVTFSFAELTPREPTSSEGKTGFYDLSVSGLSEQPGYIELLDRNGTSWYLFMGTDGRLRVGSEVAVETDGVPTITVWPDASGAVVGAQTGG